MRRTSQVEHIIPVDQRLQSRYEGVMEETLRLLMEVAEEYSPIGERFVRNNLEVLHNTVPGLYNQAQREIVSCFLKLIEQQLESIKR